MSERATLITVTGTVQGVGFRPYVRGLAESFRYSGTVKNSGGIVRILIAGRTPDETTPFLKELVKRAPAGAEVISLHTDEIDLPAGLPAGFSIIPSDDPDNGALPLFVPDTATCETCLKELRTPGNRRYRYPLISCASCGPRYTILRAFPYDRERTTMRDYPLCPACAAEYREPGNPRMHAQTVSCHHCGPQMRLILRDRAGAPQGGQGSDDAVEQATGILKSGGIVGCRSVGGYQLLADPGNAAAVRRLRTMKGREEKPFAVMFPTLDAIRAICEVSDAEARMLTGAARPILLLRPRSAAEDPGIGAGFAEGVTGRSASFGAFLPSFGALQLLTDACGPLIVTSANRAGEPMITHEEAFIAEYLTSDGAEAVLTHDREILAPVDDSVIRADGADGSRIFLRRARGYVPQPVIVPGALGEALAQERRDRIAFGGDLKATITLSRGDRILVSQPFGDLENALVQHAYLKELDRLTALYEMKPAEILCDAHPGYHSSLLAAVYAKRRGLSAPTRVFHHHAHVLSVMAEYGIDHCIGIAMDGTGYGPDGTIWGGEILYVNGDHWKREWHLPPLKVIGGDASAKDAAMSAAAMMREEGADLNGYGIPDAQCRLIDSALESGIGVSQTTSTGRRFDAEAFRLGIARFNHYEGECAAALEAAAIRWVRENGDGESDDPSPGARAWEFHRKLAETVADEAAAAAERTGERRIVLSGGSMVNRLLKELICTALKDKGCEVLFPHQAPPGDGGLGIGQIYHALLRDRTGKQRS